MKGRPPKPIEQREREGNLGKRPLPAPVKIDGELVKPELPGFASQLWDDVVPTLQAAGVVAGVDAPTLESMCLAWERLQQARVILDAQGVTALGSMGQLVEHPMIGTERAARAEFLRHAEQFGMTAAARARIAMTANVAHAAAVGELATVIDLTPVEMD